MRILLAAVLAMMTGCASIGVVSIEDHLKSAQIRLQVAEDVIPELVNSGDLTQSDAAKLGKAIDRAQEIVSASYLLAVKGLPQDPANQIGLAIEALRTAQKETESPKAKQNIGRTIAALTIRKSLLEAR